MLKRLRRLVRSDKGTSMVEFAIIAPVFIFLLIGLIEISRFAFFALLAANAARAGAQYGAQNTTTASDSASMTAAALTDGQNGQNITNWTSSPGSITANCYYTTTTGGVTTGWALCSTIAGPPPVGHDLHVLRPGQRNRHVQFDLAVSRHPAAASGERQRDDARRSPMSRARHSERGTTLPEMALVIGVLLALVFGIIDFGRALYTYGLVADMARKGARYAIVRGSLCTKLGTGCPASSADILTYVQSLSQGATDPTQITVAGATGGANYVAPIWPGTPVNTCSPGTGTAGGNNRAGCYVVVTVTYPFSFILPYMPKGTTHCGLGTASICISSTSTMLISQ